ncbi:hypothetical protein ABZZ80_33010, partial [Streptomyces sp. NPDC006356]
MENSAPENAGSASTGVADAGSENDASKDPQGTPDRRPRSRRRVLIAAVAGCAVLGGLLTLLPWGPSGTRAAPPAPGAQA